MEKVVHDNKVKIALVTKKLQIDSLIEYIQNLENLIKNLNHDRGEGNIDLVCFPQININAGISMDELLKGARTLIRKYKLNCLLNFKGYEERKEIYSQFLINENGELTMRDIKKAFNLPLLFCSVQIKLFLGHEIYNPKNAHSSANQEVQMGVVSIDDKEAEGEALMCIGSAFAQQTHTFVILTSQRKEFCRVFSPLGNLIERSISGELEVFDIDMADILLHRHLVGIGQSSGIGVLES